MTRYKVDRLSTAAAVALAVGILAFPFANPCQSEDAAVCTWHADTAGDGAGSSFTDFYGVTLYHPSLTR